MLVVTVMLFSSSKKSCVCLIFPVPEDSSLPLSRQTAATIYRHANIATPPTRSSGNQSTITISDLHAFETPLPPGAVVGIPKAAGEEEEEEEDEPILGFWGSIGTLLYISRLYDNSFYPLPVFAWAQVSYYQVFEPHLERLV